MAITLSATGYCQASDVQALIQQFAIDANSDPSTAEVEAWITEEFHLHNAMLRRAGYSAPVSQGGGSLNATSGNITLAAAAPVNSTALILTAAGLNGTARVGDSLTLGSDGQPYMMVYDAYADATAATITVGISPSLELAASAGATVTYTASAGAASVLKKLAALSVALRVIPAAFSAYGDGVGEILEPLRIERDSLQAMITSGDLDLPSIARDEPGRLGTAYLVRA